VLSKIQAAAQAQAAIAERARELKRALMAKLFTEGLHGEPLKETEIGVMPESWEAVRLGELALLVGSGVTPRGGASTYLNQGIPLIRSQNVLMNRLSLDDVAYISEETHKSMSRSVIHPNDVLLNITGASIGRVAVVPESLPEANVNQHVCRIRLKAGMSPIYLSYYLATRQGQWQILSTQAGTTRQGLNYQHVRSFQIPVPSLNEQRAIARILQAVVSKITAAERKRAGLEELFRAMLGELMTGRVRVKTLL
jgi:type I restriction enzyme S subunit